MVSSQGNKQKEQTPKISFYKLEVPKRRPVHLQNAKYLEFQKCYISRVLIICIFKVHCILNALKILWTLNMQIISMIFKQRFLQLYFIDSEIVIGIVLSTSRVLDLELNTLVTSSNFLFA